MQSKISLFNKTIFRKNITRYWPIWVGYLLICLFEIPFMTYINLSGFSYLNATPELLKRERTYFYISQMQFLMMPALIFCVAVIVAMAMLSYLYNSRSANMIHSLPVRREELFFTNYISGLLFMLVPQIIATIIDVFVCAAMGVTDLQYLMMALVYDMGMIVFFYTFAIFIGMLTGQLIALPVCYVILNFLEIGMEWIIKMLLSNICFGISMNSFSFSKLSVLSPVYFLTSSVGIDIDFLEDSSYSYQVYGGICVLCYVIAAIVLFFLALLAYKKRRIESAGDLTVFRWLKPIFRWSVTICGALFCGMIFGAMFEDFVSAAQEFFVTLFSVIISGIICFYVAEMLIEKKFKVFTKKKFLEFGVGAVVSVVLFTMLELDAFGIEKKVPNASEVVYATTDCDQLLMTEPDKIEELLAIHEQIISEKKEMEDYASDRLNGTYYIAFYYKMKDGSKFTRTYQIPVDREHLEDSDSVIGEIIALIEKPEQCMESWFGMNYETNEPKGGYLELYTVEDMDYEEEDTSFDKESAEIIYDAIVKDIEEGNFHSVFQYQKCADSYLADEIYANMINIDFCNENGIKYPYNIMNELNDDDSHWDLEYKTEGSAYLTIGKDCKNTIEALKETGVIEDESDLITSAELYGQVDYLKYDFTMTN